MKKYLSIFSLTALMAGSASAATPFFLDIGTDHSNQMAIDFLAENSVVHGYSDGNFKPEQGVTRAEALKIMFLTLGVDTGNYVFSPDFTDVTANDWHASYVIEAKNRGVVQGYGDGTFKPNQGVTRAESLKMLSELAELDLPSPSTAPYMDTGLPTWYAPYAGLSKERNLMDISGAYLYPNQPATRAEIAEMSFRVIALQYGGSFQYASTDGEKIEGLGLSEVWAGEENTDTGSGSDVLDQNNTGSGSDVNNGNNTNTGSGDTVTNMNNNGPQPDVYGGLLQVSLDSETPTGGQVVLGSTGVELLRFRLVTQYADNYLEELRVESTNGLKQIKKLYLYQGEEIIGEGKELVNNGGTGYVKWDFWGDERPIIWQDQGEVVLMVKADLYTSQETSVSNGEAGSFHIEIAEAKAANNALGVSYEPDLDSMQSGYFIPYDVRPTLEISADPIYGAKGAPSTQMKVFGFTVQVTENSADARGQEVQLENITVTISGNVGVSNLQLYRASDDQLVSGGGGCHDTIDGSSTRVLFGLSGEGIDRRRISEGSSQDYYIKADAWVSVTDGTNRSLVIGIGDLGNTSAGHEVDGDFSWSVISGGNKIITSAVVDQKPRELLPEPMLFDTAGGYGYNCNG